MTGVPGGNGFKHLPGVKLSALREMGYEIGHSTKLQIPASDPSLPLLASLASHAFLHCCSTSQQGSNQFFFSCDGPECEGLVCNRQLMI